MADQPMPEHAIIYVDAGFDLEPEKVSGMGVHGYTYLNELPKKGTGNPKALPSDNGYLFEGIVGNRVTPVHYIDLISGTRDCGTNNEAELLAFLHGLKWLEENPQIKHCKMFSDSKMVTVGTTNHLAGWPEKNWLGRTGKPVPYRALWERVKPVWDALKERMELLTIEWIQSHSGFLGNETADQLATRGKVLGHRRDHEAVYHMKEAQGYWGSKNNAPRILQAPRWYFSTTDLEYNREDGSTLYYVGCHGTKDKEDDLPGKKYADNFFGVIRKKEADPVLEALREAAIKKDPKRDGAILIGHLDTIFSPKSYKEFETFKTKFLYDKKARIDFLDAKKTSILVQLKPVGLGFRMISTLESLTRALDKVVAGDPYYRITDITDLLYEGQGDKKPTRKLKASLTQIVKYLDINAEFNLEKASNEPKPFNDKIRLILGNDILSRNQLAAIAEEIVSIKVVTWRESDLVGRYATLVELTTGDIGLWARTEANIYYDRRSL